jgi:hypothetical protein
LLPQLILSFLLRKETIKKADFPKKISLKINVM